MIIDIPGGMPSLLATTLSTLQGLVVSVDGAGYLVRYAVRRDDNGVDLSAHPWRDHQVDHDTIVIVPLDNITKIEVL